MENEDVIRDEMTDTRTSMTEKLEKLEAKVAGTVSDATGTVKDTVDAVKDTVQETKEVVSDTVEAVKDTVASVKDSVQETIGAVKDGVESAVGAVRDSVRDGLGYVKQLLDIPLQTRRHPWLVMGAAVASGFCLGRLLGPRGGGGPTTEAPKVAEPTHSRHAVTRNGGHREKAPSKGFLNLLTGPFAAELNQLKAVAVGMLMNGLRDVVSKHVPEQYREKVDGVLDSVTAKLSGEEPGVSNEQADTEPRHKNGHAARQGERQRQKFDRH
jgi:ElaB/YqjD/DUF883 family membrane-anchored ribosome-binding protein